jgi:hypothetical protein
LSLKAHQGDAMVCHAMPKGEKLGPDLGYNTGQSKKELGRRFFG